METKYSEIVIPKEPSLLVVVIVWLLSRFGENKFPGIKKARVLSCENMSKNVSLQEYELRGTVFAGFAGGCLEKFSFNMAANIWRVCAACFLRELEVVNSVLSEMLRFVLKEPNGSATLLTFSGELESQLKKNPDHPEKAVEWMMAVLDARYQSELDVIEEKRQKALEKMKAKELAELEKKKAEARRRLAKGEFKTINGAKGKKLTMLSIYSNGDLSGDDVCKYALILGIDVVVMAKRSGYPEIYLSESSGMKLWDTARVLRYFERKSKPIADPKELAATGVVAEWFLHESGLILLNRGNRTSSSFERIKNLVETVLDQDSFDPQCAEECKKGNCAAKNRKHCAMFPWGLWRCRYMRWAMCHRAEAKQNQDQKEAREELQKETVLA
ncbi:MAG: hypothetical protein PHP03_00105 [Candidatus Pacebacteria bacterium]|nr:hypothetical protein [Candidatus Paceibacterota bacterium]